MPLAVSRSYICSVLRSHVAYWVVSSVSLRQGALDNVFGYSQHHTTELMFPIETIALIAVFWPSLWLAQTLATRTTCSEIHPAVLPSRFFRNCHSLTLFNTQNAMETRLIWGPWIRKWHRNLQLSSSFRLTVTAKISILLKLNIRSSSSKVGNSPSGRRNSHTTMKSRDRLLSLQVFLIASITLVFLVGDSVDVGSPNRMHVVLCRCYRIVSAEVDVLKGIDSKYNVNKTLALLGCYTAYVGSCLPTFRDSHRSDLPESSSPRETAWPWKMRPLLKCTRIK
jgi:hypothetical protein